MGNYFVDWTLHCHNNTFHKREKVEISEKIRNVKEIQWPNGLESKKLIHSFVKETLRKQTS